VLDQLLGEREVSRNQRRRQRGDRLSFFGVVVLLEAAERAVHRFVEPLD